MYLLTNKLTWTWKLER